MSPRKTRMLLKSLVQVCSWPVRPVHPLLIAPPAFSSAGTPINKRPVLGYRNLNLFKLYRLVHKLGGFDNVSEVSGGGRARLRGRSLTRVVSLEQIESGSVWKQVYQDLGIPILNSAAGYNVKCAYRK